MLACKKYVTIKEPGNLSLSGLPFKPGQCVEVVMIAEEPEKNHIPQLQTLFKRTQALPQAQAISEDEIAAEVAAYRAEL